MAGSPHPTGSSGPLGEVFFWVSQQTRISREKEAPDHKARAGVWGGSGAVSGGVLRNPALNVETHHSRKISRPLQSCSCQNSL